MRAMAIEELGPIAARSRILVPHESPVPEPAPGRVLLRVLACGVCHTELDEIEGRTPPPRLPVVPGHEVVGRVERLGRGVTRHRIGERVGVGWIYSSTGREDENLAPE